MNEGKKILVLGTDNRSFLAVVRSFGRRGCRVHVGWHEPQLRALHSRYIAQAHELPSCDPPADGWRDAVRELIERESFDWVVPTNDASTMALIELRSELAFETPVYLPSQRAVDVTFDKLATWELAQSLDIPVPEQRSVTRADEIAPVLSEFGFPLVLKPRKSFRFGRRKWEHLVRKAYDQGQLDSYLAALLDDGPVLVQKNFIGFGAGISVLCERGEIVAAFQHERVHEPTMGGGGSYRRGVPLDASLMAAAEKLMREIELSGVCMIEFKLNRDTREWVLIEINSRFWGSLPLALASGCDFPWWLYRLQTEGERPDVSRVRRDLHCRNWWMDLAWLQFNMRADRSDPTLCVRTWKQIAAEALNFATLRERSDLLCLDDPLPGLIEMHRIARELVSMFANRLRALPWRSSRVRRWKARRLRGRVLAARNLLFICKGNIIRSPFAAQLAKRLLGADVTVTSAGYHRRSGRSCPREARTVAAQRDIDLSQHVSRFVDRELVEAAELVFVMDEPNRSTLLHHYPEARRKTERLGLMSPDGPRDVKDPYGQGFSAFELAYDQIERALSTLNGE